MNAIKSWLDAFFKLPPPACLGCPFLFGAQMSRCLVTLYRLSTYADPAWDCQAVCNTVDLLLVLDRIVEQLEVISNEAGESSTDDLCARIVRMGRMFRPLSKLYLRQRWSLLGLTAVWQLVPATT